MKKEFIEMYEVVGVLPMSAYFETGLPFATRLKELGYFGYENFLWYYHEGMGKALCEKTEMERAAKDYYEVFANEELFEKLIREINKAIVDIKKFTDEVKALDLTKLSVKELLDLELRKREQEENIFCFYNITQPENFEKLESELRKAIEPKVESKGEVDQVLGKLTAEEKLSKSGQEELDWLRIVKESKSGEEVTEKLKDHFREYLSLMLGDGEWNPKIGILEKRLEKDKELGLDDVDKRILELENYSEKTRSEKQNIAAKYNLGEVVLKIADIVAKIGHIRFEMRVDGWLPFFYFAPVEFELAKRLGVSHKLMQYSTYDEFISLFGENPLVDFGTLENRAKEETYLMEVSGEKVSLYFGKEGEDRFESLVKSEVRDESEELTGMTAMMGNVEGNAFVYIWGDDVEEAAKSIKENTILIAGQTRPQIMPIIRKCVGIITDEGGIISHAAIVARELKIPCIVGTKIATKVLKTGDKIVLDATNGTARRVDE